MSFVKANGINMYYELSGHGEPLIFISGFSTHHETWKAYSERFSTTYQTLIFDNRGSGQTDAPPPPYSIEMMANDTAALMDALDISCANMVGASMGAAIIQMFAFLFPKRIKKMALITPFAHLPRASLMKSEMVAKLLELKIPLPLIVENIIPWLYSDAFLSCPDRILSKIEEMTNNPYPQKPEGYFGQLSALQTFDLRGKITDIHTQALLVAGSEDLCSPLSCAQLMHEKLPHSRLKVFENSSHMLHIEKPEEVFKLIGSFLKGS